MTGIDFYFNVADKPGLLCRLVHGALERRQQVMIATPHEQTARDVSRSLWQHEQTSFLPHALVNESRQAPVIIHWGDAEMQYDDVLINLAFEQPGQFSRFKRLIELVGHGEEEKTLARQRYKFYRDRGYSIRHFDQANTE